MQAGTSGKGFSLVVGASSLMVRRSGIGRMTAEIIEAVRHHPEIACLRLLLHGKLLPPDLLCEQHADGGEPSAPPPSSIALRTKLLLRDVPGVQAARRVKRAMLARRSLAAIRAAGGGRVVYHEPNMITEPFAGPIVVTMNDLSWFHHPEYHPAARLSWIDDNLRRTLDSASRFVAISRFTADAMASELAVPAARIDVVPLAASPQFAPRSREQAAPVLDRYGLGDRAYVLSVSTLEPRKNFDRLVAAHAELPAPLRRRVPMVIAGGAGWGSTLANPLAERARRSGELRLLGHVPDEDLVPLYARAAAFAYVSLYEGFGLPVIEAMAAGTPVLASNTTATGETAGAAAELVDPADTEAIARGLRVLLEDPGHNENLRQAGLAHAASFSWERTATDLIGTWRRALA